MSHLRIRVRYKGLLKSKKQQDSKQSNLEIVPAQATAL